MKKLLITTAFLLMALANVSYGQSNNQLGFICVLKSNQTTLPRVFKLDMSIERADEFSWNSEEFNLGYFVRTVDYIRIGSIYSGFYINRITLDGAIGGDGDSHSCSLNTWSEVDAFVQREVSRLNNTRAF